MPATPVRRPRILIVFGTRPEAIKLAPVIAALRARSTLETRVAVTAQHRAMLDQALHVAGIVPDIDLDLMREDQSLDALGARMLLRFGATLDAERPDRILVHGDTMTTMVATLAAYFRRIPVAHVEAGLRSGDIAAPWPEEGMRRIVGTIADLHFAPTPVAAAALRAENVPQTAIHVTGNTAIDALFAMRDRLGTDPLLAAALDPVVARFPGRRIVAVTCHRRENIGPGLVRIAEALRRIADRPGVAVIVPLHANPPVRAAFHAALGDHPAVGLVEPLDHPHFVRLLAMSHIVLTDSGGVQEEAPALGKPILVLRDTTERPEGVAAGTARLVGTDPDAIVTAAFALLDDEDAYRAMARAHHPYGDGRAAERIAHILERSLIG